MSSPTVRAQWHRANCQYLRQSLLALAAIPSKAGRRKSSSAWRSNLRITTERGVSRAASGVGEVGSWSGNGSFAFRTSSLMKEAACSLRNASKPRMKSQRAGRVISLRVPLCGSCCQHPCSLWVRSPARSDSGLAQAPQSGDVRKSSTNHRQVSQSGRTSRRLCHRRSPCGSQSEGRVRHTSHNSSSLGFLDFIVYTTGAGHPALLAHCDASARVVGGRDRRGPCGGGR